MHMQTHANTLPGPGSGRLRMIRTRRGLKWRDSEALQCREAAAAAKRRVWEGRELSVSAWGTCLAPASKLNSYLVPVTRQNSVSE